MITLETDRLVIRPWTLTKRDRDVFHKIMSDEKVREFYVTHLTREESDVALGKVVEGFPDDALDWQAVCLKSTGEPIGYAGLAHVTYKLAITPCVEIGWQFLPEFWGNGYATEAAREFLRHGFCHHNLQEIVAFAVHSNLASISVMERIGMEKDMGGEFDHPFVPKGFENLNQQVLYRAKSTCYLSKPDTI